MNNSETLKRRIVMAAAVVIFVFAGIVIWCKLYREAPQPAWITSDERNAFLYGSAGVAKSAGIPYWIWLVLPRIFPEYLPGPGGYASLGFPWEETREMPAGFSKQSVGYVRVAGNCAVCHASSRDNGPDEAPTVVTHVPGHTGELTKLLAFYKQCAEDPRFNADNILGEVSMATKLSLSERLLYRFVLIPRTRERFRKQDSVMIDARLWAHSREPR